jgi:DNA polymerase I-like protein with 3'-5' exonuclease and polymerase domains
MKLKARDKVSIFNKFMKDVFRHADVHTFIAKKLFNKETVTKEERLEAKYFFFWWVHSSLQKQPTFLQDLKTPKNMEYTKEFYKLFPNVSKLLGKVRKPIRR